MDLREPLPAGRLEWGMPTRCPRCDDWGYLDRLDLVARVMQLHCPTCRFHWEIAEAQIEAANAAQAPAEALEAREAREVERAAPRGEVPGPT